METSEEKSTREQLDAAKARSHKAIRRFDGCMAAYLAAKRDLNEARLEVEVARDEYIRLLESMNTPE